MAESRLNDCVYEQIRVVSDDLGADWSSLTEMIQSPFTQVESNRRLPTGAR